MKNNTLLVAIVTLIIGVGVGFFVGLKYQENKKPTFENRFGARQGSMGINGQITGGSRMGNRQTIGEIIKQDDKSITVKLQDGSTKIVLLSTKTSINKASQASVDDLKVGEKVAVFGIGNSDGSLTAQNIQLNPIFRGPTGGQPKQ